MEHPPTGLRLGSVNPVFQRRRVMMNIVQVLTAHAGSRRRWLLLAVILATGAFLSWWLADRADREMRGDVLYRARMVGEAVDADAVAGLSDTDADAPSASRQLEAQLAALKHSDPRIRSIYLGLRASSGEVSILVSSESFGAKDRTRRPMVATASPDLARVFDTHSPVAVGPVADAGDVRVTGYVLLAGLPDSIDGQVALAMTVDAGAWRRAEVRAAFPAACLTLALALIALVATGDARKRARPGLVDGACAFAAGLALTVAAAWMIHGNAARVQKDAFSRLGLVRTTAVTEAMQALHAFQLEGLARFCEGAPTIDARVFSGYAEHLVRHRAIRAWEYIPAVPASERAAFERAARATSSADFHVWQRDASGERPPDPHREVLYPVLAIEPRAGNEKVPGFDLGSEPLRRAAIEEAARTGDFAATDLVPFTQGGKGILIFRPVFDRGADRRLRGFAVAVLDFELLLRHAARREGALSSILLLRPDRDPELLAAQVGQLGPEAGDMRQVRPLFLFGKTFVVTAVPDQAFGRIYPAGGGPLAFAAGLLLSAAVALVVQKRRQESEERQRLAEAKVKASEEKYREIVENSHDIIYSMDANGVFLFVSPAWTRLLGHPVDSVEGHAFPEFVAHEDLPTCFRFVRRVVESGERQEGVEYRIRHADGTWRWHISSISPVRDASGAITHYDGIARDITARKIVEQRFEGLFRHNPALMAVSSMPDRRLVDVNNAFLRTTGFTRAEVIGKTSVEIGIIVDLDKWAAANARLGTDGRLADFELELRAKDGSLRRGLFSGEVLPSEDNQYALTVMIDITDRQRAEDQLRQREQELRESLNQVEQFRTFIESTGDCFYMLDLDDGGRMCYVNEAAVRQFGATREEVLTWRLPDWDPDFVPEQLGELVEAVERDQRLQLTRTHRRKDGRTVPVEITVNYLKDSTGRRFGYGWFSDIAARLAAEAELEHAKRQAQAASQAKSEFLANMSHEIRTPMNGVIGMTGLLLDTELTAEQRRYAETVKSSGESLLALLNDILDFSKIEAGKLDLETLDFDLGALLDDFASSLAFRTEDKGIELLCSAAPDVPLPLRGDPGRLRQVLTNLAGNAVKFTREGEVAVRVRVESREADAVVLRFSVRDTGIGIPAEKIGLLFEKFTQADASTTRQYGGTGLGLAISRSLSEIMGGTIGVTSELGVGSEFWFTARFGIQAGVSEAAVPAAADLRDVAVLIVDDNATNREILVARTEAWGMHPTEARDAEDALQALRRAHDAGTPFRVAVIDMQMPGMDGISLGRVIRADASLSALRMVMLTSLGRRGDVKALADAGFDGYLTKPVRHRELRTVLGLALGHVASGQPIVTRHTVREALPDFRSRKARILLAEDNITNQDVALGILRKFGLTADAVANGREAIKALSMLPYDMVLMDVQMPEMDGLEATRRIRDPRTHVLNHRIPIVAMTAHAMRGDLEKCLEAGMDAYVSKPVSPHALADTLDKWLPDGDRQGDAPSEDPRPAAAPPPSVPEAPVWDRAGMLQRLLSDEGLASKVLRGFSRDMPRRIAALDQAIAGGDWAAAEHEAHTIKGAAANVGGEDLRVAASEVEQAIRATDASSARTRLDDLRAAHDRLMQVVQDDPLLRSTEPSPGA